MRGRPLLLATSKFPATPTPRASGTSGGEAKAPPQVQNIAEDDPVPSKAAPYGFYIRTFYYRGAQARGVPAVDVDDFSENEEVW